MRIYQKVLSTIILSFLSLLPTRAADTVTILPNEADRHLGKVCTVEMLVRSSGKSKTGGFVYLNSESDFRRQINLAVILEPEILAKLQAKGTSNPGEEFYHKWIRVTGRIQQHKGITQLKLEDAANLSVMASAPVGRTPQDEQLEINIPPMESVRAPLSEPTTPESFKFWIWMIAFVAVACFTLGYVFSRATTLRKNGVVSENTLLTNRDTSEHSV